MTYDCQNTEKPHEKANPFDAAHWPSKGDERENPLKEISLRTNNRDLERGINTHLKGVEKCLRVQIRNGDAAPILGKNKGQGGGGGGGGEGGLGGGGDSMTT